MFRLISLSTIRSHPGLAFVHLGSNVFNIREEHFCFSSFTICSISLFALTSQIADFSQTRNCLSPFTIFGSQSERILDDYVSASVKISAYSKICITFSPFTIRSQSQNQYLLKPIQNPFASCIGRYRTGGRKLNLF